PPFARVSPGAGPGSAFPQPTRQASDVRTSSAASFMGPGLRRRKSGRSGDCGDIPRMREFRMGEAAALLGVGVDTLRRLADAGEIATRRTQGGHRVVDGRRLAAYLAKRGDAAPSGSHAPKSARNHLRGLVTRVVKDRVMAHVEMQVGPHRVVSLMSREA